VKEILYIPDNTVVDIDRNAYTTVNIGTQTWFQANLKTTKYNDGTDILYISNKEQWQVLNTPAYCWYDNDLMSYKTTHGALYNWHAVNTGKLCPIGWHIPTNADWDILLHYFNDSVGFRLITQEFKGLLSGARSLDGMFWDMNTLGFWWSADEYLDPYQHPISVYHEAWYRAVHVNLITIFREEQKDYHYYKSSGMSVRCIKD
jgi:uncharacterized protein (TIGR02145 family)